MEEEERRIGGECIFPKCIFQICIFPKCIFSMCIFQKCIFPKCYVKTACRQGAVANCRRSGWEPDRLSNKLHSTKLLLLLNKLKNTFSNAISFAAPYIHMILPHLVINWIPAIATGHSHTSVGSSNNLHSFAKAAATAAAAAAQCIKVLLHEHYSSSSYAIRCILHLHTHLHTFNAFLSRSSRSYC